MKKYSINKEILLSFLDHEGSGDYRIDPRPNEFVVIDNGNVYLEQNGKLIESNNTVGSMKVYIENNSIVLLNG